MNISQYTDGDSWFLIFHHNVKYGDLFKDVKETLYYKGKSKFSILSNINDKFKINNQYFEFKITYPECDDYIQFTQTTNPISTIEIQEGTVEVKKQSKLSNCETFEGLALSGDTYSLLDSNGKKSKWFYAIGQMKFDSVKYKNSFPGPYWYCGDPDNLFHEVNLYIKVINWNLFPYLYSFHTCINHNSIQIQYIIIPFIALIIK